MAPSGDKDERDAPVQPAASGLPRRWNCLFRQEVLGAPAAPPRARREAGLSEQPRTPSARRDASATCLLADLLRRSRMSSTCTRARRCRTEAHDVWLQTGALQLAEEMAGLVGLTSHGGSVNLLVPAQQVSGFLLRC